MKITMFAFFTIFSFLSFISAAGIKGSGGPDQSGYRWLDSDESGGPVYGWVDISTTGTLLTLYDDDCTNAISTGINFNYYGTSYNSVRISSNGVLSFDVTFANSEYYQLPSTGPDWTILAALWKDLNVEEGGGIYYKYDSPNNRFIVQYENVPDFGTTDGNTFQVILNGNDNTIVYQYKEINGTAVDCSSGIQNQDGTVGLSLAYNSVYIKDSLAVKFYQEGVQYGGEINLSVSSLDYGNVTLGRKSVLSFTVTNVDQTKHYRGSLTTPANYFVQGDQSKNTIEINVSPNSSKIYDLTFTPISTQTYNGYFKAVSLDLPVQRDSIYVTGSGVYPNIAVTLPDTLRSQAYQGLSSADTIAVKNTGLGHLIFGSRINQISKASGGPDSYGYKWSDSDETDGPEYAWNDISLVGTAVNLSYNQTTVSPVNIGFNFNYYGTNYSSAYISASGFIAFVYGVNSTNSVLPNASSPLSMIAPFWSGLSPSESSKIYYHYNSTLKQFIVQYDNVPFFGSIQVNTFQIILLSDNSIIFQYKTLNGATNACTVGIQNATGTVGLQTVYNSTYLKNNFAIEFKKDDGKWLSLNPSRAETLSNDSSLIKLSYDSQGLALGSHISTLYIDSTDPDTPTITQPVKFTVKSVPVPVLSSPVNPSYLTDLTPTFDWADLTDATSYTILVDNNSDFSSPEISQTATSSTYTPGADMSMGTYYWKVKCNISSVSGSYSSQWTLNLGTTPGAPVLSSPASASSTTDLTPTFDWADVSGATSYTILVDNNSNFSSPEINQSPTASTYTPGANLASGTYYWKVLATNNFGSSTYSSAWNVRLYIVPAVPANVTTSVVSGNIFINWDDSASATSYDVYYSAAPYGTYSLLTNVSTSEYTYTSVSGNAKMFFKVVAKNATKESPATIEVFEER